MRSSAPLVSCVCMLRSRFMLPMLELTGNWPLAETIRKIAATTYKAMRSSITRQKLRDAANRQQPHSPETLARIREKLRLRYGAKLHQRGFVSTAKRLGKFTASYYAVFNTTGRGKVPMLVFNHPRWDPRTHFDKLTKAQRKHERRILVRRGDPRAALYTEASQAQQRTPEEREVRREGCLLWFVGFPYCIQGALHGASGATGLPYAAVPVRSQCAACKHIDNVSAVSAL